ncbi:alkaline shock response membrane anchor protein AmaP [Thermostichus vulcanus]|uniref:Uncharacterized protein n=1 Tax=Thermostichus vulcanus str. 'Rupite' TaxID=2813851 RepID=A0ABT0C8N2_THEVL|nr:alkaline shock response membrane anchor protein AmaP [Thermostichus vulcanus]MCJ2542146.1 hypothetical protein [Thermostichus vulcanus str. 'Rupite']
MVLVETYHVSTLPQHLFMQQRHSNLKTGGGSMSWDSLLMQKTKRVLVTLAIIICLGQIAGYLVDILGNYLFGNDFSGYSWRSDEESWLRPTVYWGFGGLSLTFAIQLHRRFTIFANGLGIAGVYLMLYGNRGGWYERGFVVQKLILSILTLVVLALLSNRLASSHQNSSAED